MFDALFVGDDPLRYLPLGVEGESLLLICFLGYFGHAFVSVFGFLLDFSELVLLLLLRLFSAALDFGGPLSSALCFVETVLVAFLERRYVGVQGDEIAFMYRIIPQVFHGAVGAGLPRSHERLGVRLLIRQQLLLVTLLAQVFLFVSHRQFFEDSVHGALLLLARVEHRSFGSRIALDVVRGVTGGQLSVHLYFIIS